MVQGVDNPRPRMDGRSCHTEVGMPDRQHSEHENRHMLRTLVLFLASTWSALAFAAVDVYQATPAELDSVNGLGPATSTRILQARKTGSFKNWADLGQRVPGIKDKRARLSDAGLTVDGTSYRAGAPAAGEAEK
jgi:competence protein ComEA